MSGERKGAEKKKKGNIDLGHRRPFYTAKEGILLKGNWMASQSPVEELGPRPSNKRWKREEK